ncbi:MAG: tandem-95 repeat protein, partial [Planctomycetales bacterium]|nr:tandem-95 repeat protein [Planctomycetales bacterium]
LTTNPGVAVTSFTQDDVNNGRVVYVHDGSNTVSSDFNFSVDDGQGNSVTSQTFAITVTPVDDDAPTVVANTGSTVAEGGTDAITEAELEFIDTEQPATAVTYSVTSGPSNGQLELSTNPGVAITSFTQDDINNGRVVYVHDGSNTVSGDFNFNVDDGQGNSVTGQTFSITVTPVNDDPVNLGSLPAVVAVIEDVLSDIDLSQVNLADNDAAGLPLTLTLTTATGGQLWASAAAGVVVTGSGTGQLTLTGAADDLNAYLGGASPIQYLHGANNTEGMAADTISVAVTDNGNSGAGGGGWIALGDIQVDIAAVNDSPTALSLSNNSIPEGAASGAFVGTALGTDPDAGDTLTYTLLDDAGGAFALDGVTGALSVADASLLDHELQPTLSITVQVTDSGGLTHSAVFTILVTQVNEAPVAAGESYAVLQIDSLVVGAANGVLTNDSDPDGDPLTALLITDVANGTLVLNADGSFTYTPDSTFAGVDSFTYAASDGSLASSPVVVQIRIDAVAAPPPGSGTGDEDNSTPDPDTPNEDSSEETPLDDVPEVPITSGEEKSRPVAADSGRNVKPTASAELLAVQLVGMTTTQQVAQELQLAGRPSRPLSTATIASLRNSLPSWRGNSPAVVESPLSLFYGSEQLAEMGDGGDSVATEEIVLGAAKVVTSALSVGYVVWMVRGGTLLASMAASLPAWTSFDPMPILGSFQAIASTNNDEDDESLSDLVG